MQQCSTVLNCCGVASQPPLVVETMNLRAMVQNLNKSRRFSVKIP